MPTSVQDFRALIASQPDERQVQAFLEANPHLFSSVGISHRATVIRQFPLGADFRPDFALVHANSGGTHFEFIELENPRWPLFNADDSFSQHCNHALQQLFDWLDWSKAHRYQLIEMSNSLVEFVKSDKIYIFCTLVMGHRRELSNRRRQERFESRQHPGEYRIRTYDGFAEAIEGSAVWYEAGWRPSIYGYRQRKLVKLPRPDLGGSNA